MDLIVEIYKTVAKYCEENGYLEALVTIIVVSLAVVTAGGVIGWLIGRRGVISTINKTDAETQKTKLDQKVQIATLLDRADERRKSLQENQREMDVLIKDVMETVRKGKIRILRDLRNEICEINSNLYMPSLANCIDDCVFVLPRDLGRQRVMGDIIPALKLQQKLFIAMNHQHFLDKIRHAQPYLLDKNASEQLFSSLRKCIPWYHRKNRRIILETETSYAQHVRPAGT